MDRPATSASAGRWGRLEGLGVLGVLGLAALLRLPGIESRGRFDSDQGHDMFTLLAFVRDGIVPLLGPKTSVGEFHHGAFYYFLLAPAAALSNADPVVVTAWIALLGIGAVALTWWLGRSIGGPVAGLVAGLVLAVSPAAIEESTFIWNPNPIPFFAALALAAAWRARSTGRSRWWALAIGAAGAVMELHILGVLFLAAILLFAFVHARQRGTLLGILGGLAVVAVLLIPLAIHESQTGFQEVRLMLDYLRGGDQAAQGGPLSALAFTLLRVVGWPLVGLVTDVPAAAAVALALLVGLVGWRGWADRGERRIALAWLVALVAWSTVTLAFVAPSLQQVVAGLPNDHYHAFLDPVVAALLGVSIAPLLERGLAAWRARAAAEPSPTPLEPAAGPAMAAGVIGAGALIAILALEVIRIPPPDPDGGWASAQRAGQRIVADLHGPPVKVASLPDFKSSDGIFFPIVDAARRMPPGSISTTTGIVVVCDRLFESVIGARCGGPAEDRFMFGTGNTTPDPVTGVSISTSSLVDRFDASARTSVSVYLPVVTP